MTQTLHDQLLTLFPALRSLPANAFVVGGRAGPRGVGHGNLERRMRMQNEESRRPPFLISAFAFCVLSFRGLSAHRPCPRSLAKLGMTR